MRPTRDRLLALLHELPRRRVVVLADLVADEYVLCRTSRISREAPAALILRYESREVRPGGGANAVANIRTLGAEVDPVGVVGADPVGEELRQSLAGLKVETAGIRVEPSFRTIVKSRVLTSYHHSVRQQVLRVDREDDLDGEGDVPAWLVEQGLARLDGADALLVSDYGYGAAAPEVARELIAEARRRGLTVMLDSRYRLLRYPGVTAATPNEPEVEEVVGHAIGDDLGALEGGGREVLARLQAQAVVVTRGSKGMALFERDRPMELIPVYGSDEIADVTGAGDTVIAVFTLALAAGATCAEAAWLANYAGGIVVLKMGTATVSLDELETAVAADAPASPPR